MRLSTGIFFFILFSIWYAANAQNAFRQVRVLMRNLKNSVIRDQRRANVRERKSMKWCKIEINKARKLYARRHGDVVALRKHVKWIIKTRAQERKDRIDVAKRIRSNLKLLRKFKKQRCSTNLIFVKQLREHMQGVRVLKLLRKDIIKYFNSKKKGRRGVFLQQFEEFSSLLDEQHKQVFAELKSEIKNLEGRKHRLDRKREKRIKTKTVKSINKLGKRLTRHKARTKKQIGRGHIDNKRGALKRLRVPKHVKIATFNRRVRRRILRMIRNLIKHLRRSRRKLTRDEIKAATNFAIFHNSMERENAHLRRKIKKITREILDETNQYNVARVQLRKRVKLCRECLRAWRLIKKMCREKRRYFKKETRRRFREKKHIDGAIRLFNRLVKRISKRVKARANAIATKGKLTGKYAMKHRAVKSTRKVMKGYKNRRGVRKKVVF